MATGTRMTNHMVHVGVYLRARVILSGVVLAVLRGVCGGRCAVRRVRVHEKAS